MSSTMTGTRIQIWPLEAATYRRHMLHEEGRAWVEKNCYVDVWIEALHAQGLDPMPMLPFTLAMDFEGDQWTFFKPRHGDIHALYGIEVNELNVWRPLIHHVTEHVANQKLVVTEADAFFLPDTQGTDYRQTHTKTTIIIQAIDVEARRLGYFHNASYYELEGADFAGLFRLDVPHDPAFLPLFAEFAKVGKVRKVPSAELVKPSIELLRANLARRPSGNPITRFGQRFATDLDWLKQEGLAMYHAWAFATVRQIGAGYELTSLYLKWLEEHGEAGGAEAAADFDAISQNAKALILKGARAVNSKKAVDFAPMIGAMESAWSSAMERLASRLA